MHPALSVALAMLVPFVCTGVVFWLARLEDTLADDLRVAARRPAPQPIRAVPVEAVETGSPTAVTTGPKLAGTTPAAPSPGAHVAVQTSSVA